jgi:hypothetical protein
VTNKANTVGFIIQNTIGVPDGVCIIIGYVLSPPLLSVNCVVSPPTIVSEGEILDRIIKEPQIISLLNFAIKSIENGRKKLEFAICGNPWEVGKTDINTINLLFEVWLPDRPILRVKIPNPVKMGEAVLFTI